MSSLRAARAVLLLVLLSACAAPAAPSEASPSRASSIPTATVAASDTPAASPAETPTPSSTGTQPPAALDSDPLHRISLTDVRTGASFTLGELAAERPLLLETMAIWCTNCRAQMHRLVEAHARADFHSVGIDVDASEVAGDLAEYVEAEGFDWHFAMADREVADSLRDRFGTGFLFPPNTPMALLLPDGTVRALDFGGYSVDELLAELGAG